LNAQPDQKNWRVVVFSDFLCPSCRRFATFLDNTITPLFDGRLSVVFKHYPLDRQCNGYIGSTTHRNACAASFVAEAARLQGGNDAFWKVHDRLFARRYGSAGFRPKEVGRIAVECDLDAIQLRSDLQSTEVATRVAADIELARACGVTGTPAVFLNGKRVDPLAITEIGFWDAMADRFWTEIGQTRPVSTLRHDRSATPDSPGPTDVP
jgi:protein-disulfide isomerase